MTPKAQLTNAGKKIRLASSKQLWIPKDMIKKLKRKPTERKKILDSYRSYKGLEFIIYKRLLNIEQ